MVMLASSCKNNYTLKDLLKRDILVNEIANNNAHEVQLLYTSVNLKDTSFTTLSFNVDKYDYFYPASVVKLPVAILSLERLNELGMEYEQLNMETDMITDVARPLQTESYKDSTTVSGKPNIKRYIEKSMVVSENEPYNRLYEFLGPDYINSILRAKGVFANGSVINHRLEVSGFTLEENSYTNPIYFLIGDSVIYRQPETKSRIYKHQKNNAKKGKGYIDNNGEFRAEAFDFSEKNYMHIEDMQAVLLRLFYPDMFSVENRFNLTQSDYSFLKTTLSAYPNEYSFYQNQDEYPNNYVKFFMIGDQIEPLPNYIKIYNKVGQAYGYLTDNAYIEDSKNNIAFFLTAVIKVNNNDIYNDNNYEYDDIGIPFLAKLGRLIYNYELENSLQ